MSEFKEGDDVRHKRFSEPLKIAVPGPDYSVVVPAPDYKQGKPLIQYSSPKLYPSKELLPYDPNRPL